MATVNVNKGGGPLDAVDNFPGAGLQDYHDSTREFKPSNERPDWRVEVARGAVAFGALLLLGGAYWVWKSLYCWNAVNWARCGTINELEPLGVLLLFVAVGGLSLWRLAVRGVVELRTGQAKAARIATTFNRFSNPVRVDLFTAPEFEAPRYAQDVALKAQTAPYEIYHSINQYSPTLQAPKDAPALPAPALEVAPVAPDVWLGWVDTQPHVILAAETGGGKTTTAKAILAPRIAAGEQVFIIDPHADAWFDLPTAGGGENWAEVRSAIEAVTAEYQRRMDARKQYHASTGRALDVAEWTRLTVLLDEANITKINLDTADRRGAVTPWQQFAHVLGSGARKVRISIVLLCQSANVEDLGLSGPMRENFLRIALDSGAARKLIDADEKGAERKKALHGALAGRTYPAVCEYQGQVHLLDRTGLDKVAQPSDARCAAWDGWSGVTQPPTEGGKIEVLRQLRAAGWGREAVRASGLRFDNNDWADAEDL